MLDDFGEQALDAAIIEPVPRPVRPRVWTAFVAVVLATVLNIGFSVVVVVGLVFSKVAQGSNIQQVAGNLPALIMAPMMFTVFIAIGSLAYGLGAVIPAWLSPTALRERLGLSGPPVSGPVYLLAMLGSILPLAIALGIAEALTLVIPPDESLQLLFDKMTLESSFRTSRPNFQRISAPHPVQALVC